MYEFVIGWRLGFITSVIGPCVFGVYGAGVVVISIEGPDVSESLGLRESRDILSPVGHL